METRSSIVSPTKVVPTLPVPTVPVSNAQDPTSKNAVVSVTATTETTANTPPDRSTTSESDTTPPNPPSTGESQRTPPPGLITTHRRSSNWNAGYCLEVAVENTGAEAVPWRVWQPVDGEIDRLWNAVVLDEAADQVEFGGMDWNRLVQPGEETAFGFCVSRSQEP